MSKHRNPLAEAVRLALVGVTAAGASLPAMAQDQDDAEQLETITVVGSRIKRTDIETSQPVFVVEREDLQRTGLTSIGDILQELTNAGAAINTTFNNAGNGEARSSLRNLGSNRTLVLVNGRRWVPGASGTTLGTGVDLNTIPVSIIERVEVLKDGASAIYGSDAIAGVINIITRDSYDGAEASAYIGEWEQGDGRTEAYDFTIGSSSERASVVLNISYTKQEPVWAGDREISAVPVFNLPADTAFPGGPSTTSPQGRYGFGPTGGRLPDGSPGTLTLIDGRSGGSIGDYRPFQIAGDSYNFAPDNYLLTPQERVGVYLQGRYDITDNVSFRTEALFNERRSEQLLAATPIVLGTLGSGGAFGVNISADNIYNPFGQDVTRTQFRPVIQGRSYNQDVDTFRFGGTFEGSFDFLDRAWSWDVGYVYGDNEQNDTNLGAYNVPNLALGLGPSFIDPVSGAPTCGTPDAPIAGCVPINLLGGTAGFTQEMFEYIAINVHDQGGYEIINYTANVTGDLFELPAGPLAVAAGYEYRREFGFDDPDAFVASGNSTGNSRLPTEGGYSIDEFYLEFNIPVLSDMALADLLEFSVATRFSDYSTFGETTNSKFGFRWKPVEDLLVRGNWAEGFRAPNVTELFGGQADSFVDLVDPCDAAQLAINPQPASACFNGIGGVTPVPAGYEQANTQIRITVGGNPTLQPELATNKTLGFVYSPGWAEGLDIYLDWYSIKIENLVFAGGLALGQLIMNNCYFNGQLDSCALIARVPASGDVFDLEALSLNTGELEQEGYDFTVSYRFDTDYGKFRVTWDSTYMSKYVNEVPAGAPQASLVGNYFQFLPVWRLKSNIDVNWQYGDWGATLGARYLSALDEDCSSVQIVGLEDELCTRPDIVSPTFGGPENVLDETWYWDLQGTWEAPWNARVTVGVNNFLDEDPPLAYSAFANTFDPQYDVPGRFWYVQYTQRF